MKLIHLFLIFIIFLSGCVNKQNYLENKLYCQSDKECTCDGIDTKDSTCFIGNIYYYEKFVNKNVQCPDFCGGIAGNLVTKCVNNQCQQVVAEEKDKAVIACVDKCKSALANGEDFSKGPCLLNPILQATDWVCDVAHSPRQAVDNLAENQCSAYREGLAKHFVEVDVNCNFIKAM